MAKPFSIQAPENIAKEYGGNKQKIAEAMQMGLIDPTAGVLAGMFIDRMRTAQMQEAMSPPTVAQEVMGGAPPAPPPSPTGASGAPPMAPPMNMPQGMPPEMMQGMPSGMGAPPMDMPPEMGAAPMGMAEGGEAFAPPYMAGGGLSELPIPDTMFDEDRNGGYAGGGMVAFATGGGAYREPQEWGEYFESLATQNFPGMRVTSRMRSPEQNRLAGGVPNSYHKTGAARDFVPPKGMSLTEFGDQLRKLYGPGVDVIYNTKGHFDHVHVEPGRSSSAKLPERDIESAAGRASSLMDQYAVAKQLYAGLPESGLDEYEGYLRKELDPETQRKARKDDMWMSLASIGANMAASKSPYFLQATGEALAATLPGVRADKKERKEAERDARTALREVLGLKRAEQKQVLDYAMDLRAVELGAEGAQLERQFRREEGEADRLARYKIVTAQINAEREMAKSKGVSPTEFDKKLAIIMSANPGMTPYQALTTLKKEGFLGGSQSGIIPGFEGEASSNDADTSRMSLVSSRPAQ